MATTVYENEREMLELAAQTANLARLETTPQVSATCTPELAGFIDPTGALRRAGLLKVQT